MNLLFQFWTEPTTCAADCHSRVELGTCTLDEGSSDMPACVQVYRSGFSLDQRRASKDLKRYAV